MFENRSQRLLSRQAFLRRLAGCAAVSFGAIVLSLGIGMVGYSVFEKMSLVDAFVNAAMILSGMGPVGNLTTDAGKIFAGCYALFSGLVFVSALGLVVAPIFHRFIHKFHLEQPKRSGDRDE
jgi:hypothetical protein